MQLTALPIFEDNYVWLARVGSAVLAVDPGDAVPLLAYLREHQMQLAAILITHHHRDHTGGLPQLAEQVNCPVYGPASIAGVTQAVTEGQHLQLAAPGLSLEVMAVPGHTLDHLAYYGHGVLFCGDTLFACGCGRLMEGTPAMMQASLARFAALPRDTLVCCTHEYTLANQRFALAVEPDNVELQARHAQDKRTRDIGLPTLPSTINKELATNPMLRWSAPAVVAAARRHGATGETPVEVFAAIRRWKDSFK